KPELTLPAEALVIVERVVPAERRNEVARVDRPPKPLEPIILIGKHFDMLDRCAAPNAAHGETIDLVVRRDPSSSVADGYVSHHAGIIIVVVASIGATDVTLGKSLDLLLSTGHVQTRSTEQYHTPPEATIVRCKIIWI